MRKLTGIVFAAAIIACAVAACDLIFPEPDAPTPPATLSGIAVTTPPARTQYSLGEELDTTGMVVTATYSDGSTAAVTDYYTSGYVSTTLGNQDVTVTYNGKTAQFTVNVIDLNRPTVATPEPSVAAGTYSEAQSVALYCATESAAIYYTTDGSNPTEASAAYSGAIGIGATATLKAFAVKEGMNNSGVMTAAYTIAAAGGGTAPSITTASLPNGTAGTAYSQTLAATGDAPITWSLDSGALPAGLSLAGSTGVISGTPSAEGTSVFTVKAANSKGSGTRQLSISIAAAGGGTAPAITTASLPNGTAGTAYSQTLAATGDAPITWSLDAGALPSGLSLGATGVISGTPSAAGTYAFTVKASNSKGSATRQLSITIASGAAPAITFEYENYSNRSDEKIEQVVQEIQEAYNNNLNGCKTAIDVKNRPWRIEFCGAEMFRNAEIRGGKLYLYFSMDYYDTFSQDRATRLGQIGSELKFMGMQAGIVD